MGTYKVAKDLADLLDYYQKQFLIKDDEQVIIYPCKWDDILFQLCIQDLENCHNHKKIIYTRELLRIINEFKKNQWKLLKFHDHKYLYDNTTEESIPPLMKVMSTPLKITFLKENE